MAEAGGSPTATHAICILVIVLAILGIPMMMPELEEGESWLPEWEELNPLLMLSPLLLLLLVRFLGSSPLRFDGDASTIHRVGGSPTGILLLLVIVFAMISFRSLLQESLGVEGE